MPSGKVIIEHIHAKEKRFVAFSKRRKGLFSKASALCSLNHEVAIIVFSGANRSYSFGHPSIEGIAHRYLNNNHLPIHEPFEEHDAQGKSTQPEHENHIDPMDESDSEDIPSEEHEEREAPNINAHKATEEELLTNEQFWWNKPIDALGLDELRAMEASLAKLRSKVIGHANTIMEMKPLSLGSLYVDQN